MYTSVVAMFCGPHENGAISYRRIDVAIQTALRLDVPLVIVGDGNNGRDLLTFASRAFDQSVACVITRYDATASTLADANLVGHALARTEFKRVLSVHLVTDRWHMARAHVFLKETLSKRFPGKQFNVIPTPVETPPPPRDVLEAELRGIADFVSGKYGTNGHAVQYGKPAHPASVSFGYEN